MERDPEIGYSIRDENQPFMREVLEKMMESTESDGLTESVTEESAEPGCVRTACKKNQDGVKKYKYMVTKLKSRLKDKVTNPKVVTSKAAAVVISLSGCPVRTRTDKRVVPCMRQTEGQSAATNVVSRIDIYSLKSEE